MSMYSSLGLAWVLPANLMPEAQILMNDNAAKEHIKQDLKATGREIEAQFVLEESLKYSQNKPEILKLLKSDPNNPKWILGLAIALDVEGDRKAALENYQKLQAKAGVDTGVLKYVQERIKILENY